MNSQPNGGFLPIYICDKESDTTSQTPSSDNKSKREYEAPTHSISIKTLMEKRRAKNPLLPK